MHTILPISKENLSLLEATQLDSYYTAFCSAGRSGHLLFAAHAAYPAVLSVDLLHKIRQNFRLDEQGREMNIPAIAVSDLLLSGLCRRIGNDLYEIPAGIRSALLGYLSKEEKLGSQRLRRLAYFLKFYLRDNPHRIPSAAFRRAQTFVYQAELEPEQAARTFLDAWNRADFSRLQQLEEAALYLSEPNGKNEEETSINPLGVAIDLVRQVRAFQQGAVNSEEVRRHLAELQDILEVDTGTGIRLQVPAAFWEAVQDGNREAPAAPENKITLSKVHLLTQGSIDKHRLFKALFGWQGPHGFDQPVNVIEAEYLTRPDGGKETIHQITWQYDIEEVSPAWDRMLITENGLYVVAVQPEWSEEKFYGYRQIQEGVERIRLRVGDQPVLVVIVRNEENAAIPVDEAAIRSAHPNITQFIEITADNHNALYELTHEAMLRERAPLKNEAWERVAALFQLKQRSIATTRQEFFRVCEENGLSDQEGFQLIVYLTEAGRMIAPLRKAAEDGSTGLRAGKLLITAPETFIREIYPEFKRHARSDNGVISGQEWRRSLQERTAMRSLQDELIDLLENFALLYYEKESDRLVVPSLIKKQNFEPSFDVRTTPTTYISYRFPLFPPDLIACLHACFGAAGWKITASGTRGFSMDVQGVEADLLAQAENTLRLQVSEGKNGESILADLTGLIEANLKAAYYNGLPKTADRRSIPAHATPEVVTVPGGTFMMGWLNETRDGRAYDREKPAHEVKVSSFAIGKYPVTFEEYDAFCVAEGREKPKDSDWGRLRRPVINIDWYDALEYCNWLSGLWGLEKVYEIDKQRKDPNNKYDNDRKKWLVRVNEKAAGYRLPTEAEWEYAARGGPEGKGYRYAGSDRLDEVAWYDANAGGKTHPVGEKKPNELGLYDMSGNVWEWCRDWFDGEYYQKLAGAIAEDPQGPESGSSRVLRGGSWYDYVNYCRVAYRVIYNPDYRNSGLGFRLARTVSL